MADPAKPARESALLSPGESPGQRLEALLEVSETIAQQRDLQGLFRELAKCLHAAFQFDFLALILHDAQKNTMRLHILESREEHEPKHSIESRVEETAAGWVLLNQEPFVSLDTFKDARYPEFMQKLQDKGVHTIVLLPLTTAQHRLGVIGVGRYVPEGIGELELEFMKRLAAQVAVAVDNAINFEAAEAYQKQLAHERDRLQVLLQINNVLLSTRDISTLFKGIVSSLKPVIPHDYTSLTLLDPVTGLLKVHALDLPPRFSVPKVEFTIPIEGTPAGSCFSTGQLLIARGAELGRYTADSIRRLREQGVQVMCCVPLKSQGRTFGTINLASRDPDAFLTPDIELLQQVAGQVAIALENALAFEEIDALKDKLAVEKLYLEEEIRAEFNFEEIIGDSPALRRALSQVELAAPASTTVLILGETGTGKELIARAIHNRSPRRERTFVKVNCAAIPAGLLESELFGHERGAFTGA
ncbi:MAG TPA: GAF domain-containing protein, partial [Candidatus Acidoferrum sp.]